MSLMIRYYLFSSGSDVDDSLPVISPCLTCRDLLAAWNAMDLPGMVELRIPDECASGFCRIWALVPTHLH